MACPHKQSCDLFPLLSTSDALKPLQSTYCEGEHRYCVRHERFLEGKPAPFMLLPNGAIMNAAERARAASRMRNAPAASVQATALPRKEQSPAVSVYPVQTGGETVSAYCLRIRVKDQLGVAEGIKSILRDFGVGIDALIQKQLSTGTNGRMLVLITDQAPAAAVHQAVLRIEDLGTVDDVEYVTLGAYD